jgi:hypothetical protein
VQADTPYKIHYKSSDVFRLPVLWFALPPPFQFPFAATFKLIEECLAVASLLVLAAVPLVLISRELWKVRVR